MSDETAPVTTKAPTYRNYIGAFTDFLTVAIHTILYERKIYPQSSFLTTKKYEFAVRQNRHPKVCEWINDTIDAVEAELVKCTAERVAVVIYGKDHVPQERFIFDVSRLICIAPAEVDMPLERKAAGGLNEPILPLVDLEEQLRGAMNRLANCGSALKTLPKGCTFTVAIELKPEAEAPLEHPQPWAPALDSQLSDARAVSERRTKPISAVSAGDMLFDMWVEEIAQSSSATD